MAYRDLIEKKSNARLDQLRKQTRYCKCGKLVPLTRPYAKYCSEKCKKEFNAKKRG